MSTFKKYSAYYDLLYQDKDYLAEATYVAGIIRKHMPQARSILELGSGTGRHGRILATMGFDVFGVERSEEMVSYAQSATKASPLTAEGSFQCEVGDIRSVELGRTFDVVISLFHVLCYQTSNEDLKATFESANRHLVLGGLFFFDVWHGPAVLTQGATVRIKEVADTHHRVRRVARPVLDSTRGIVKVTYDMECGELESGQRLTFSEEHIMRYLFPTEIDFRTVRVGLQRIQIEAFLTGATPSNDTWGVFYGVRE